jgi:recombination protein U
VINITRWNSIGHRGDGTEELINAVNEWYDIKGVALITKIPTPIKVLKLALGKIVEAFFEDKSTVDYNGMVQGRGICFDAKETDETSFPLKNIHQHQIDYMRKYKQQKGYSFIICNFKKYGKFYMIPYEVIHEYWKAKETGGRKSIPIDALDERYIIPIHNGLPNYIITLQTYIDDTKEREKIA